MSESRMLAKMRWEVFARDGYRCMECLLAPPDVALELDHIIPLAAGGSHTYDNVACAHRACNLEKGDALPLGSADPQRVWVHQGMGGIA